MFDNNEMRCDPATKITLLEMEQKEIEAYKAQDYEILKSLSTDLITLRTVSFFFFDLIDWNENLRFKELTLIGCMEKQFRRCLKIEKLNRKNGRSKTSF